MTNLDKLSKLIPNDIVSRKVFDLYKRRAGTKVNQISEKAIVLHAQGYKVERAMADALVEALNEGQANE